MDYSYAYTIAHIGLIIILWRHIGWLWMALLFLEVLLVFCT